MRRNVIFCYSGTGNCLDIAKNIARRLGNTDIIMMRSQPVETDVRDAKRVGFIFSCMAGGLPGHVEEYVRQVKVAADAYTFGVASCAGYMGIGLNVIDSIIPLNYWSVVRHQSSAIWLMPHTMMIPPMGADKAQALSERRAAEIADDVFYLKCKDRRPYANPLNVLQAKKAPALLAKKAAEMTVTEACNACGICVKLCPQENIELKDGRASIGLNCIGCLSCLQFCPQEAINMGGATLRRERYHNPNVSAHDLMQKKIHID